MCSNETQFGEKDSKFITVVELSVVNIKCYGRGISLILREPSREKGKKIYRLSKLYLPRVLKEDNVFDAQQQQE